MAPPRDYTSWEDVADEDDDESPASAEDEAWAADADDGGLDEDAFDDAEESVWDAAMDEEEGEGPARTPTSGDADPFGDDQLDADDLAALAQVKRLRRITALIEESKRLAQEIKRGGAPAEQAADPRYPAFTDAAGVRRDEKQRSAALDALRKRAVDGIVAARRGETKDLDAIRSAITSAGGRAGGRPANAEDPVKAKTARMIAGWRDRWEKVEEARQNVPTAARTLADRMRLPERGLGRDLLKGLPVAERLLKSLPERKPESAVLDKLRGLLQPPKRSMERAEPNGERQPKKRDDAERPPPSDARRPRDEDDDDSGGGDDDADEAEPADDADEEMEDGAGGPKTTRKERAREDREFRRDAKTRGEDPAAIRDQMRERRKARRDENRSERRSKRTDDDE